MADLTIKSNFEDENNNKEEVLFSFNDIELEIINKFIENCKRLSQAKLIRTGLPSFNIKWDRETGFKIQCTKYQYDHICELLHLLRPLILSSERASFDKIKATMGKKSANTILSKYMKVIGDVYKDGLYKRYVQISIKNIPLFQRETVNKWLNGIEYHQDKDKAEMVNKIKTALSDDDANSFFIAQLWGQIYAIFMLQDLLLHIIKKKEEIFKFKG